MRSLTDRLKRIWGFGFLAGIVLFMVLGSHYYLTMPSPPPLRVLDGTKPVHSPATSLLGLSAAAVIAALASLVLLSARAIAQERGRRGRGATPIDSRKAAAVGSHIGSASPSRGVQILLNCTRNDVLDRGAYLDEAIEALRSEGAAGSRALASLLREMLAARTAGILWALAAAPHAEPVPELDEAVSAVGDCSPTTGGTAGGRFTPEIVGGGRIGWTDSTHAKVRERADKALAEMRTRREAGAPASGSDPA